MPWKAGYEASAVAVLQNALAVGKMRLVSGLCTPDGPDSTRTWCVCPPEVMEMTGNGWGAESGEIRIGMVN